MESFRGNTHASFSRLYVIITESGTDVLVIQTILSRHCTNVAERNLFSVLCSRALVSARCPQPAPNARSFERRCKRSDAIYAPGKIDCLPLPSSSTPVNFWRQDLLTNLTHSLDVSERTLDQSKSYR